MKTPLFESDDGDTAVEEGTADARARELEAMTANLPGVVDGRASPPPSEPAVSTMASKMRMKPARIIASTFLGVILVGTALLMLPCSSAGKESISFIDALFTSTSATCVTGLVTLDTGTALSGFGQFVTMVLFQIGGLGIMTLSAAVTVIFLKRMNLRDQAVMRDMVDPADEDVVTLLKYILKYTILIEVIGAIILTLVFYEDLGWSAGKCLRFGVYHSISAFCNAGFGLMSDSLASLKGSATANFTVMALIILGGLGFSVLLNLHKMISGLFSGHRARLSLHSRIVIMTSAALTIGGAVFFIIAEWNHAFGGMTGPEKTLAALFQSVTCRTAGFSTVGNAKLTDSSLLLAIMLMFIGASPGSTGGASRPPPSQSSPSESERCFSVAPRLKPEAGPFLRSSFTNQFPSSSFQVSSAFCSFWPCPPPKNYPFFTSSSKLSLPLEPWGSHAA